MITKPNQTKPLMSSHVTSRHVTSPRLVSSKMLKYDMYAWRKRRVAVLKTPRNPSTFRMSSCAAPTDAKLTSAQTVHPLRAACCQYQGDNRRYQPKRAIKDTIIPDFHVPSSLPHLVHHRVRVLLWCNL